MVSGDAVRANPEKKNEQRIREQQEQPVVVARRSLSIFAEHVKTNPQLLTHGTILQLQRTIGNRAVLRIVDNIQRAEYIKPRSSRIGVSPASGTNRMLQRQIPPHIYNNWDVFFSVPPLTLAQGQALMERIENRDPTVLNGLQNNTPNNVMANHYAMNPNSIFSQEWGLGEDRNPGMGAVAEAVLISGGNGGVAWGPYLNDLIPHAHSHPYFQNNTPGTRAIGGGGIRFDDINGVNPVQNINSRLKVFPSSGDVNFCLAQNQPLHTVYTPYVWVQNAGQNWVANYNAHVNFANAPRIHFQITNAQIDPVHQNQNRCTLTALVNGNQVWQRNNVIADANNGQAGLTL